LFSGVRASGTLLGELTVLSPTLYLYLRKPTLKGKEGKEREEEEGGEGNGREEERKERHQAPKYYGLEPPLSGGRNFCHCCSLPLKIRHCPLFRGVRASGMWASAEVK